MYISFEIKKTSSKKLNGDIDPCSRCDGTNVGCEYVREHRRGEDVYHREDPASKTTNIIALTIE